MKEIKTRIKVTIDSFGTTWYRPEKQKSFLWWKWWYAFSGCQYTKMAHAVSDIKYLLIEEKITYIYPKENNVY
jgi:hypothetical protein